MTYDNEIDLDSGDGGLEVALLTRWHDAPDPSEAQLSALRRDVLAERAPRRFASSSNRPRRRTMLAAVAAAVAAVLVVPAAAGQFWPSDEATVSAAEQLNDAADELIESTDFTVAPGQWLYITSEFGYPERSEPGRMTATQRSETWVPSDQSGDWYLLRRDHGTKTPYIVAQRGAFYGSGPSKRGSWNNPTPEFYASVPRDTTALRDSLYPARYRTGSTATPNPTRTDSPDRRVFMRLSDILREGLLPADLRAALYRVLATIPGMEVTEHAATLNGETGVAFQWRSTGPAEIGDGQQIVIDPKTGQYIGERSVSDDGTVSSSSSLSYDVVDAVPDEVVAKAQRVVWSP